MADTVLTELKIHEFDSLEQMSQYESEIGDNDLVFTPDLSCRLPLLTPMWFDHITNDISWLRADTFSWQSGDVYVAAYEHLTDDFRLLDVVIDGTNYWAYKNNSANPSVVYVAEFLDVLAPGTPVYYYDQDGDFSVLTDDTSGTETSITADGTEYTRSQYSAEQKTDTIDGTTITYYQAEDGHKICLPDQESNVTAIYNATGIAWYYILDTENKQFKLPRTKYGFTGLRDSVGGYVAPGLPNVQGSEQIIGGGGAGFYGSASGALYPSGSATSQLAQQSGGQTYTKINIDASRSSSIYGASDTVQPPATQMYLYFYVGNFEQSAIEQTAGITAETLNGKADTDLGNIPANYDYVVESQMPTADNGYTWYRKYKSGWVEQGGRWTGSFSISARGVVNTPVTLPVPMADATYQAFAMATAQVGLLAITNPPNYPNTTTTLNVPIKEVLNSDRTVTEFIWQVSGMSAQ